MLLVVLKLVHLRLIYAGLLLGVSWCHYICADRMVGRLSDCRWGCIYFLPMFELFGCYFCAAQLSCLDANGLIISYACELWVDGRVLGLLLGWVGNIWGCVACRILTLMCYVKSVWAGKGTICAWMLSYWLFYGVLRVIMIYTLDYCDVKHLNAIRELLWFTCDMGLYYMPVMDGILVLLFWDDVIQVFCVITECGSLQELYFALTFIVVWCCSFTCFIDCITVSAILYIYVLCFLVWVYRDYLFGFVIGCFKNCNLLTQVVRLFCECFMFGCAFGLNLYLWVVMDNLWFRSTLYWFTALDAAGCGVLVVDFAVFRVYKLLVNLNICDLREMIA
eukprot:gene2754-1739_t